MMKRKINILNLTEEEKVQIAFRKAQRAKVISGKACYKRVKYILSNNFNLPTDMVMKIFEFFDFNLSSVILNSVKRKKINLINLMSEWKYIGIRYHSNLGEYRKYNTDGDEEIKNKYTKRFGELPTKMKKKCDICDSRITINCYIGKWKTKEIMTVGSTCASRFVVNSGICIICAKRHKNTKNNYCNDCRVMTKECIDCFERVKKGIDRCEKCEKNYIKKENEKKKIEKEQLDMEENIRIWKINHCTDCNKKKSPNPKFSRCRICNIKWKRTLITCPICEKNKITNPKYNNCFKCR